jgi:hypothetical protein
MEGLETHITDGDGGITSNYVEYYKIGFRSDTYKRILTIYSDRYINLFPYFERKEIKWYRCYRKRPNEEKDGYVGLNGDEYKFLETKFIIFKRKQKIEKLLNNIKK